MIVNFITDEYLEKFYPDILNYKAGGQNDYSGQIRTATERLLDDLVARNISPRLCMVPLDLNRGDASIQQLTTLNTNGLTFTGDLYHSKMYKSVNQRRAFLSVIEKETSDSWLWTLVGSNEVTPADASDESCEDVLVFEYAENDIASDKNQTFIQEYKWYGFILTRVAGTGNLKFKAAVYETVFDRLIAYKALELIAASWKTGNNPRWDERRDDMQKEYESLLETIRINMDLNEDGVVDEPEKGKKVGATIGSFSSLA